MTLGERDERVDAMRAQVEQLQSRIPDAGNDALDLALQAIEICLKALDIVTEKSLKQDLNARCRTILTEAERIKAARKTAAMTPQPTTPSRLSGHGSTYSTGSVIRNREAAVDITGLCLRSPTPSATRTVTKTSGDEPLVDIGNTLGPAAAHASPNSRKTQQLPEPVSSRTLSTSEQILLMHGSRLNGCKFPPWQEAPKMNEFLPDSSGAKYTDGHEMSLSAQQQESLAGWKRARDALPPPNWPTGKSTNGHVENGSIDLVQDGATDCSVVAGICAAIARAGRGHGKLLSNIIWPYDHEKDTLVYSPNAKFILRLNFNGCWRKVVIDDHLPVSKTAQMLHVVDRNNPSLLWPALLEKAYLKVRGGYDFPGSSSSTDLWALTGWIPDQIFLQNPELVGEDLWRKLLNSFRYGDLLITAGTGSMSPSTEIALGLEGQHNYAVIDMEEKRGQKMLQLKNPWAEGKGWRGAQNPEAHGDGSGACLTKEDGGQSLLDLKSESSQSTNHSTPGTFWISLEHLFQNFDHLYVNWNPSLFKRRQDIHFSWEVSPSTTIPTCLANHPQILLSTRGDESIWLLLSRHFKNAPGDSQDGSVTPRLASDENVRPDNRPASDSDRSKLVGRVNTNPTDSTCYDLAPGHISLYVFDQGGKRVYTNGDPVKRGDFVNSAQLLYKWDNPAASTYTVVVEQNGLPPDTYNFTLTAFSLKPLGLNMADSRYLTSKTIKSGWTELSAGGNTQSPTFGDNPQFRLTVPQRTALAILLKIADPNAVVHVLVLHGQGKRVHNVKSRDVIADSRVYKKHCALAEIKELDAGTYTIACSTFQAGVVASFDLQVDSNVECGLEAIPREGAGRIATKLTSASFESDVKALAAPIVPNTLTRISILAKFVKSYGSQHTAGERQMGSPIRLSLEMGRGPNRSIIVASGDGDYSDVEGGVRIDETDISPQRLHRSDLWLVIDRLAGTGSRVPEVYSLEMFSDKPNAVKMGVWRTWQK